MAEELGAKEYALSFDEEINIYSESLKTIEEKVGFSFMIRLKIFMDI